MSSEARELHELLDESYRAEVFKRSLSLHENLKGKIEVRPRVELNRDNLSLCYTPGVGAVSHIISKAPELVDELTLRGNSVAVVSDGTAVLGLGDVGPKAALPVMEGKALLFKELAGIDAVPICLHAPRAEDLAYMVKALEPSFGGINLEDVKAPKCFEVEELLDGSLEIPLFHDDQHGTAVVVLAALINALKLRGSKPEDVEVVINGIGAAGTAIAKLLLEFGVGKLVLVDVNGILNPYDRKTCLHRYHLELAKRVNPEGQAGTLEDALKGADVFIGVSRAGLFKRDYVKLMADRPIIMALANPIPEIYYDEAIDAGAFIACSGRSDYPNQVNNLLGFPGIFRGLLDARARKVTVGMRLAAAKAIADTIDEPRRDQILPDPLDRRVVVNVAFAVALKAIEEGVAGRRFEGADQLRRYIEGRVFSPRGAKEGGV